MLCRDPRLAQPRLNRSLHIGVGPGRVAVAAMKEGVLQELQLACLGRKELFPEAEQVVVSDVSEGVAETTIETLSEMPLVEVALHEFHELIGKPCFVISRVPLGCDELSGIESHGESPGEGGC